MIQKTAVFALSLILTGATAMACSNANVQATLSKDVAKYKTVKVTVEDCAATLSGTVERYSDKLAIGHTASKHGVTTVTNNIVVNAPMVGDADLAGRLEQKLRRRDKQDISGPFTVTAVNGAVTVTGVAHSPMVHNEAIQLIASTRGVRDIVDQIRVDEQAEVKMMPGETNRNPTLDVPRKP